MTTAQQPTATQQRAIEFKAEWRRVLHTFQSTNGRYSGAQVSRARGIARKNLGI